MLRYYSESEFKLAVAKNNPSRVKNARSIAEEELAQNKMNENNYAFCYYYLSKILKQ